MQKIKIKAFLGNYDKQQTNWQSDQPNKQPPDKQTNMSDHREFPLPITPSEVVIALIFVKDLSKHWMDVSKLVLILRQFWSVGLCNQV